MNATAPLTQTHQKTRALHTFQIHVLQVPMFTFANKQDLPGALSPGDLAVHFYPPIRSGSISGSGGGGVGSLDMKSGSSNNNNCSSTGNSSAAAKVFSVSGITGQGIDTALNAIILEAKRHHRLSENQHDERLF